MCVKREKGRAQVGEEPMPQVHRAATKFRKKEEDMADMASAKCAVKHTPFQL